MAHRTDGTRLALFGSEFQLRRVLADLPELVLTSLVSGISG